LFRYSLAYGELTDRTVPLCVDMQNMFALDTASSLDGFGASGRAADRRAPAASHTDAATVMASWR